VHAFVIQIAVFSNIIAMNDSPHDVIQIEFFAQIWTREVKCKRDKPLQTFVQL